MPRKEDPAISLKKASITIGFGESTIVREGNKIKPPIKTRRGLILVKELPRLKNELEKRLGRKPSVDEASQ